MLASSSGLVLIATRSPEVERSRWSDASLARAHTSMPGKRPPRLVMEVAVEDAVEAAADVSQAMTDMNRRFQLTMESLPRSPGASPAIEEEEVRQLMQGSAVA